MGLTPQERADITERIKRREWPSQYIGPVFTDERAAALWSIVLQLDRIATAIEGKHK